MLACPNNHGGNCTGAPGSVPATAGGCCGQASPDPSCGCAWGVTAEAASSSLPQSVTCCDISVSSTGHFVACTATSRANGTCSACCTNGDVIGPLSRYDCCNNKDAMGNLVTTCCSNPATCYCPNGTSDPTRPGCFGP
jgi:hypothetical protein